MQAQERNSEVISIESIVVVSNPRTDYGDIDGLAADIATRGLLEPLILNEKRELVDGHRRLQALQRTAFDRTLGRQSVAYCLGAFKPHDQLNSVHAIASNDVWVGGSRVHTIGSTYKKTLTVHWDGNSWTVIPSP